MARGRGTSAMPPPPRAPARGGGRAAPVPAAPRRRPRPRPAPPARAPPRDARAGPRGPRGPRRPPARTPSPPPPASPCRCATARSSPGSPPGRSPARARSPRSRSADASSRRRRPAPPTTLNQPIGVDVATAKAATLSLDYKVASGEGRRARSWSPTTTPADGRAPPRSRSRPAIPPATGRRGRATCVALVRAPRASRKCRIVDRRRDRPPRQRRPHRTLGRVSDAGAKGGVRASARAAVVAAHLRGQGPLPRRRRGRGARRRARHARGGPPLGLGGRAGRPGRRPHRPRAPVPLSRGRRAVGAARGPPRPRRDPRRRAASASCRRRSAIAPRDLRQIAFFYTTPGFCDEAMHVFRATGLVSSAAQGDEDERIEVAGRSRSTTSRRMIDAGEIREGKTLVALLLELAGRRPGGLTDRRQPSSLLTARSFEDGPARRILHVRPWRPHAKGDALTIQRLFAIAFIFSVPRAPGRTLGASVVARTGESDQHLAREVAQLWGGRTSRWRRAPPWSARARWRSRSRRRTPRADGDDARSPRTVSTACPLLLDGEPVRVDLELDQRRKGLLWYATYGVAFAGTYRLHNPDRRGEDRRRPLCLPFRGGAVRRLHAQGRWARAGHGERPGPGGQGDGVPSCPGPRSTVEVAYRSRGIGPWTYSFGPPSGVAQVRDFTLDMTTDFDRIDFPGGTHLSVLQGGGRTRLAAALALRQPGHGAEARDGPAAAHQSRAPGRADHLLRAGVAALLLHGDGRAGDAPAASPCIPSTTSSWPPPSSPSTSCSPISWTTWTCTPPSPCRPRSACSWS